MATDAELLTAVEAALLGTLVRGASQYSVNGRTLQSLSPAELMALRSQLKVRIARAAGGESAGVATFGSPT